ncbi:glycoside hydrolase family 16 protein [Algoriphagus sp.]|uniref:glycoside hydrolase family 16 protein n=1 Tax=Algoriphagus sp. TaxID=1872435 RepID=UPI003F6E4B0D
MKALYIQLFLVIAFSCCSYGQQARLIWSEEFSEEGLPDPTYWVYDVGDHGWGNDELQYYTQNDLKNSRVENGKLVIEAHVDSSQTKGYSSARLLTRGIAAWKYGYIEVRARLPQGRGTWPAIWMLPEENNHGGWPKNGEIDIMEHVGYEPGKVHGTVHTEAYNHKIGTQQGGFVQVPDFDTTYHNYAIDWTEEKIDFLLDGDIYFTFHNSRGDYKEWPFDQPFHLILNIAVGGGWGGQQGVATDIWPQRMEVDYVRVYNKKP